jgi:hypothetical protein
MFNGWEVVWWFEGCLVVGSKCLTGMSAYSVCMSGGSLLISSEVAFICLSALFSSLMIVFGCPVVVSRVW